jgi:hypothetical protein
MLPPPSPELAALLKAAAILPSVEVARDDDAPPVYVAGTWGPTCYEGPVRSPGQAAADRRAEAALADHDEPGTVARCYEE